MDVKSDKNLKFSILIPVYKSEFLCEAIESVLKQTYENLELIILNDASPENIDVIINNYSDERIRYYKNDINIGAINVVDNWNKCLNNATGDYIICIGDDDMLESTCLEEYSKLIREHPLANVLHSKTLLINEKGDVLYISDARENIESVYQLMYYRWRGRSQFVGDFCYKRSALIEKGGFYKLPLAWASDDITAYIQAQGYGVVNCNKPLFRYRMSSLTISSSSSAMIKMEAIDHESLWYSNFLSEHQPSNSAENIFYNLLVREKKSYILKKKLLTISGDITRNFSSAVFWIRKGKRYGITYPMMVYCLIMSIIGFFSNKYKKGLLFFVLILLSKEGGYSLLT